MTVVPRFLEVAAWKKKRVVARDLLTVLNSHTDGPALSSLLFQVELISVSLTALSEMHTSIGSCHKTICKGHYKEGLNVELRRYILDPKYTYMKHV